MKNCVYILALSSFLFGCYSGNSNENNSTGWESANGTNCILAVEDSIFIQAEFEPIDTFFDRSSIIERLQTKKENKHPLIVHVYVPLCDNEHQGIVPTTPSLGNGMSLKSNLYWATSGGTKAYFKKQSDWKLIYEGLDIDTNVLERVVFEKNYDDTKVYLVADAYRGDRMEETVNDYLAAISGNRPQTILLKDSSEVKVADAADLIMFNGHNGVMDYIDVQPWINLSDKRTDIVMNACVSYGYLQEEFMLAGGYPLVRSNSLLYPGAYVLEQIVDDWVVGIDEKQLCLNAGATYCKKHDCGYGTKVYSSGW
ncbi:MAG: hypothetical protein GQ574_21385 [Crocinitomix sp.]|nr:hypothetical protein [Crocinitomix sp.]